MSRLLRRLRMIGHFELAHTDSELVGFDTDYNDYTYVNYGLGQFYLPYSPVYVALSLLLGVVLIVAIAFAISQRNRRPRS